MQKLKMVSLISVTILLTGCSMTKINQSEELTGEITTGEITTGIVDSGMINNDVTSGTQMETTTSGETATEVSTDTTIKTDDTAPTVQENLLKEKIRILIEQRKIDSKAATELTEDDIQLMEDILKEIVDETSN